MRIELNDGLLSTIEYEDLKNHEPLDDTDKNRFKLIVENYTPEIIKSWIDLYVYNKAPDFHQLIKKID